MIGRDRGTEAGREVIGTEGGTEGGREADAIVTVIVALEVVETMQQATTSGWEESDKATAITKQQASTPAEVQVLKG